MSELLELYPQPGARRPLHGLHLGHDIRSRSNADGWYFCTGFLTSVDGRIAVGPTSGAPAAIRNDRDWRLFQELIAQADVVLVSGRYVRDLAGGKAKSILADAADPRSSDLIGYRRSLGLPDHPAVAVVTRSGVFDTATAAALSDEVFVAHGEDIPASLVETWVDAGLVPIRAGIGSGVDLDQFLRVLRDHGHRIVFSAAGPSILSMVSASIDALYLTLAGAMLGGIDYSTMFEAAELDPPLQFDLASAYLDSALDTRFQIFLELTARRDPRA